MRCHVARTLSSFLPFACLVALTSSACAAVPLPGAPSDTPPVARAATSTAAGTTTPKVVAPAPPTREVCTRALELACQPGVPGAVPTCWDSDWGWVRLTSTGSCPDLAPESVSWSITPSSHYIGAWHRAAKVPTAVWTRSPWGEVEITATWPGGGKAGLKVTTAPVQAGTR